MGIMISAMIRGIQNRSYATLKRLGHAGEHPVKMESLGVRVREEWF
jgi:hypothetical protein